MEKGLFLRAALIGAAVTFVLAPSAQADQITEQLILGNDALSGFPTPFGSVTINRTSTTDASITFTSNLIGTTQYSFGDGGSVALNTNGAVTVTGGVPGGITSTPLFATATPVFALGGAGNEDGFGSFNFTLNDSDGFGDSVTLLSFAIHLTSGSWSSASNVLAPNSQGFNAAAHVFVCTTPCSTEAGTLATGFATVPGPILGGGIPGLVMAGAGLLALARRRRQKIV
jgi:hypothetical protein